MDDFGRLGVGRNAGAEGGPYNGKAKSKVDRFVRREISGTKDSGLKEAFAEGQADYFTHVTYKRYDRLVNRNLQGSRAERDRRSRRGCRKMKTARTVAPPGRSENSSVRLRFSRR